MRGWRRWLPLLGLWAACGGGGELPRAQPAHKPPSAHAPDPVAPPPVPPAPPPAVAPEANLGVHDVGIFSDLDARVQLALPVDLKSQTLSAVIDAARSQLVLYEADWPLKVYPLGGPRVLHVGAYELALRNGDYAELAPLLDAQRIQRFDTRVELPPGDADGDGIPDPLDVQIGAHKLALNADRYDGRYVSLKYPLGDPPRTIGVCTDVVIRALRNAGYDLQRAVAEDISRARFAYPMIKRPNPSIDHRRVKSLLPYFERHFERHSERLDDPADPYRPGDVLFMDTFGDRPGAEHIGLVGDVSDAQGRPLVVNNWTDGTVTGSMPLLAFVPVTARFRVPPSLRAHGPIGALRTQLLTVVSDDWERSQASLRRYARAPGGSWREVGKPIAVVLGHAGYGWGDGLHGAGAPPGHAGPEKREGDGRSPAGAFELGTAYGYAAAPGLAIAYQASTPAHVCVDDPASSHYNQIFAAPAAPAERDFRSAERMRRDDDLYSLAIVVEHNFPRVQPGHGSCIFLHVWSGPDGVVTGCTAMARPDLEALAHWLEPNAAVLVALPRAQYASLQRQWQLP